MKQVVLFILLLGFYSNNGTSQLYINEVSQGSGGNPPSEYIELVVVGDKTCTDSCLDIRGWIIDDNAGFYGNSGIADGHLRFSNDPQWECVPYGCIIVLYNNQNPYPGLTADPSDANQDNVYILSPTSNYIESNSTLPSGSIPITSYGTGAYSNGTGNWNMIALKNDGDVFQLVNPLNPTTASHSVGWGNNIAGTDIYNPGNASGKVLLMDNVVDNDVFNQSNWVFLSQNQGSPGLGNSIQNTQWINAMRQPFTQASSVTYTAICDGDSVMIHSNWEKSQGQYTDTIYTGVCDSITIVNLAIQEKPKPLIYGSKVLCIGKEFSLFVENTYDSYIWNTGDNTHDIVINKEGEYIIEVTLNGCTGNDTIRITEDDCFTSCMPYIPNAVSANEDGFNDYLLPVFGDNCGIDEFEFTVFNRWGSEIFFTNELGNYWDVKHNEVEVPLGVYIWKLNYKLQEEEDNTIKIGHVVVFR